FTQTEIDELSQNYLIPPTGTFYRLLELTSRQWINGLEQSVYYSADLNLEAYRTALATDWTEISEGIYTRNSNPLYRIQIIQYGNNVVLGFYLAYLTYGTWDEMVLSSQSYFQTYTGYDYDFREFLPEFSGTAFSVKINRHPHGEIGIQYTITGTDFNVESLASFLKTIGYQDYYDRDGNYYLASYQFDPDYAWDRGLYLSLHEIEPGTITLDVTVISSGGKQESSVFFSRTDLKDTGKKLFTGILYETSNSRNPWCPHIINRWGKYPTCGRHPPCQQARRWCLLVFE
ncbi:MAG: hypothetical protein EZS28_045783, partial [Streblomastix strix]